MLKRKKSICFLLVMLIFSAALVVGCTPADPVKPDSGAPEFDAKLLENYPEYCGLDASNGLDVYVWQMAARSYSFGVLPHSETPRESFSEELMFMKGVNAPEMRKILEAYHIDKSQIHIIPWQNPISSYIGDYWMIREGEDPAQVKEEYVDFIEIMLFGEYMYPVIDTVVFDVDEDGKDEYCVLGPGPTSGVFSFTFYAFDTESEQPKYEQVFVTEFYYLSFVRDFLSNSVYIKGVTQGEEPQTHYYAPIIQNGQVLLEKTEYEPSVNFSVHIPIQ